MDTALGLVNLGISESEVDDRATLVALAGQHGCHVAEVIAIDENTCAPRGADESRERRYSPPVIAVTG